MKEGEEWAATFIALMKTMFMLRSDKMSFYDFFKNRLNSSFSFLIL